jgi:hypothetical protein
VAGVLRRRLHALCYCLTMGTVASVSVLGATSPFFAALLAWLLMRERTSAVALVATVVALVGVAIVVQAEMSALATGFCAASSRWAMLLFRGPDRVAAPVSRPRDDPGHRAGRVAVCLRSCLRGPAAAAVVADRPAIADGPGAAGAAADPVRGGASMCRWYRRF